MSDPYRIELRPCCARSFEQEHASDCPFRYPTKADVDQQDVDDD